MAKKKKNQDNLPEGMSRRQAKLAARAAERAKLEKDPRPYGGYAMEADLVALQEFVPSAHFAASVEGIAAPVHIVTVLPGAVAGLRRSAEDGGECFAALQTNNRGNNPNRDLAFTLNWLRSAEPGQSLDVGVADGSEPQLRDLLPPETSAEIAVAQDFNWWLTEAHRENPQVLATLNQANESVLPSERVGAQITGAAWWIDPGERGHIRWVHTAEEGALLDALARVHAAGKLHLGEGSKFAGAFRTHGILVPVWDVDNTQPAQHWKAGLETVEGLLAAALEEEGQLTGEEHKAKQTIISREVTIR
ncbi:DUF5926 family protein [Corynebacterium heidelbergense]|uniref:Preprotein translocase subunit SecA n=1 Tax=Corynebacterium heidelbergense TaxID=2055947 RepID=A0A364V9M0_9CORY|nr:DUF5926 family protein [Corynebacterium heidelbergense]RAV33335.1 preprotein translocase subunit SecA [Corynebacterium heidelbergense]WCZ35695.1 hypothetical protein CHEID_00580 [Corynebacterium heidelbergense]